MTAFAALFVTRLYYLQIVHGKDFAHEADSQYVATLPNLYDRGSIYFKSKDGKLISAATVGSGYVIAIDPKTITLPEETYRAISQVIKLDHE